VAERAKRRNVIDEAVVGDLVVAVDGGGVTSIEQVSADRSAQDILTRWLDQGITGTDTLTEVWEAMPSSYYRRRRLERLRTR
jgi:hypothetical protein